VDLDEILYWSDGIEGDIYPSKMADVWAFDVVQLWNQFVDLDDILYGGEDIEGGLDAILFNLVASSIA
jgi:hypothetical protein